MADHSQGWVDDPAAVEAVLETLPFPVWGSTPASAVAYEDTPEEFLGWKVHEAATGGKPWPIWQQGGVGSCVSFGTSAACLLTLCAEIVRGEPEEVFTPCMESVYALSRVEIGGRKLGRGDGSVGAWAAKAVRQFGLLPQGTYINGKYDLTRYSEQRARDCGWSGLPDDLEPYAKKHPIRETTLITTFKDAVVALSQGYGIQVASRQGFSMTRDREGFCSPRGSWAHSMGIIGYRRGGKRPGAFIVNSWGGNTTTGPIPDDGAPPSGWWADAEVAERMLKQGDSFAFSDAAGMPARSVDWSRI
jgi:hypothetical protein